MADGISRLNTSFLHSCLFIASFIIKVSFVSCCGVQTASMKVGSSPSYITSPRWPRNYPTSVHCTWKLYAQDEKMILFLTAKSIDIEGPSGPSGLTGGCSNYDYLEIFDGPTADPQKSLGEFCGNGTDVKVETKGPVAFVVFHSDYLLTRQGFKLYVNAIEKDVGITDEKGPNMKAIIGGVGGGILCSILFVTFACCCLSPNRSPCRRGPQQRTVSPADRPQASRHRPVRRDGHRRNPSSVSTISTSMFTPHLNRGVPSMAHPEEIPLELRPPPYTSAPPPPLEIEVIPSSASNSSSSPPPPYAEHDPHPNCVRSDSVPSYHSR